MLLYVLLTLAILTAVIIAVVAVGPTRFIAAWNAIPAVVRTWLNVAAAALLAAGGSALLEWISDADIPLWVKITAVPFLTSLVRAVNPADNAYGLVLTPPSVDPGPVLSPYVVTPLVTDTSQGTDAGTTPPVA